MSGITGVFRREGISVDPAIVEEMNDTLDFRGPDVSGTAVQGECGFGQQRMVTTPEARYEKTPERTDKYLLTADARIDNRKELQTDLNISPDPVVTDADLILAAYDRWGKDCAERLIGAFSFAIWDADEHQLFCARDHVGLKPFFYIETKNAFAFASEISPLLNLNFVNYDLDEIAVALYLLGYFNTPTRTIYKNIRALPPSHWAIITTEDIEMKQYWSLDGPKLELGSDEAYLNEFKNLFEKAVRARLRTPDNVRVGSLLSGGLDSSSIACTANSMVNELLPTFSLTFEDIPGSDESEYITAVHDHRDFDPHFVQGDRHSPFEHADEMLRRLDFPFISNTLYLHWELYRSSKSANVRVLLGGYGGDQTVSQGTARLPELLLTGHPIKLIKEITSYAERYDKSIPWILYQHILTPLEPESLRKFRRQKISAADPVTERSEILDERFASRMNLEKRIRERTTQSRTTTRADHRRILRVGTQSNGCEIANISAATFGIEPRFPFFDRRVMEFCFRTPGHLKFRNGWRRWLLRNSLSDTLPPKIRNRASKGDLGVAYCETLRSEDSEELRDLFTADQFPPYLDQERVQSEFEKFMDGDESKVLANVWRPALLCRWFQLTDRYE